MNQWAAAETTLQVSGHRFLSKLKNTNTAAYTETEDANSAVITGSPNDYTGWTVTTTITDTSIASQIAAGT